MINEKHIFILITLMFLVFTFSLVFASGKIESPKGEKLAGIACGDSVSTVIKVLGEPEKKGEPVYWAAIGQTAVDYSYETKGVYLTIILKDSNPNLTNFTPHVYRITIKSPCKKGTSGGIKIGDTADKVKEKYVLNYGNGRSADENTPVKDTDDLSGKCVYCGSQYRGILFVFDENEKVKSISMGTFAE